MCEPVTENIEPHGKNFNSAPNKMGEKATEQEKEKQTKNCPCHVLEHFIFMLHNE